MQFTRLYEHIKNDKYLVGRRLVNYDHKRLRQEQQMSTQQDDNSPMQEENNAELPPAVNDEELQPLVR